MIWRVRDIEIDDIRFELRRAGLRVAIAPKPLAVLLYLARRHPASVDREELLERLWPGVRVTPSSLARAVRAARRAIGERADDGSTIRTVRGRGYALSVPPTSILPGGVPFVGRVTELATVEQALGRAALGRGCIPLVGGAPGIGKTALATELLSRARHRDMLAVVGTCRADAGAPPWWPWPEVVDEVVRHHGEGILHGLGPADDSRALVARLSDAAAPSSRTAEDRQVRFRLLVAATTLLRRAADVAIVVVATFRTSGAPRNGALEAACGELSALPHALPEMRLAGLAPEEIAAYVSQTMRFVEPSVLARRLHRATGGNPLFLRALLSTPGALGSGAPADVPPVPRNIEHVLRQQWRLLSRAARAVVESAAAIGRAGSLHLLGRVSRRDPGAIRSAIEEAQNLRGLDGDDRFRFTCELTHAAVRQHVHPRRRAVVRKRLAPSGGGNGNPPPSPLGVRDPSLRLGRMVIEPSSNGEPSRVARRSAVHRLAVRRSPSGGRSRMRRQRTNGGCRGAAEHHRARRPRR